MDLPQAIANWIAGKADKKTISAKLNQALGIIAKTYDVPEDQIKELKREARKLFGMMPEESK
jgi:hypothetical protein